MITLFFICKDNRKINGFFQNFFGLKFVPVSAFGFYCQAARRGLPLYSELLEKVRSLAVVYADEKSWRLDGHNYWLRNAGNDDLAFFRMDARRAGVSHFSHYGPIETGRTKPRGIARYFLRPCGGFDWFIGRYSHR